MRINSSHSNSDRGLDAYFTPREAIVSLIAIEQEHLPKWIWEPACGDGAIVRPLREAGYNVTASDIKNYGFPCEIIDYFRMLPDPTIRGIVTNPPFKLAIRFAEKALIDVPYLALLLRTNFLESTSRLEFFRRSPPSRIWVSSRRLPQMHRHDWSGPEAASNIAFAWFIWDKFDKQKRIIDWFDWGEFCPTNARTHVEANIPALEF